jgi:hypothetical protein
MRAISFLGNPDAKANIAEKHTPTSRHMTRPERGFAGEDSHFFMGPIDPVHTEVIGYVSLREAKALEGWATSPQTLATEITSARELVRRGDPAPGSHGES